MHGFAICFTKNKCYPVKVILHLWQLAKAKVVFKEETKIQIAFCIVWLTDDFKSTIITYGRISLLCIGSI